MKEKLRFKIDNGVKIITDQKISIPLFNANKENNDCRAEIFDRTGKTIWNKFKVPVHWGVVAFLHDYTYEKRNTTKS